MEDNWLQRWNDRYQQDEYVYGTEPNEFFKEQLLKLNPGKILLGAEGEGRNAVYAATLGWKVNAFDISIEGRNKALQLAQQNNVLINYHVGQLPNINFDDEQFDAIALIYAHFPPNIRSQYHKLLDQKLKKGGWIIFEAFGKNHLQYRNRNPKVGGPPNLDLLFSIEELQTDFVNYHVIQLEETEVELNEGLYHIGKGSAIRFVAQKR